MRKAIIPAAGLGTQFLPATKAQPKEMLSIVDKPSIQDDVDRLFLVTANKEYNKMLQRNEREDIFMLRVWHLFQYRYKSENVKSDARYLI